MFENIKLFIRSATCGKTKYMPVRDASPTISAKVIINTDNPEMNSCAIQVDIKITAIPTSGCRSNSRVTSNKVKNEYIMPLNLWFTYCFEISHAVITLIIGFKNSDGCNEKPNMLSHRLAPFISVPKNNVQNTNSMHTEYPIHDNNRICLGCNVDRPMTNSNTNGIIAMCRLTKQKGFKPSFIATAGVDAILTQTPIPIRSRTISNSGWSIDINHLRIFPIPLDI